MNIFLDFETFFTREYSLRKMPTIEYVRDPRFEILGCAIALGDKASACCPQFCFNRPMRADEAGRLARKPAAHCHPQGPLARSRGGT